MVVCPQCTPDGDFGLVDENLVLGHAVFVNQSDIELLASKHGSITHHASCNLVVRNGIAPVYFPHKAGVMFLLVLMIKGSMMTKILSWK